MPFGSQTRRAELRPDPDEGIAAEALDGLLRPRKTLPAKLFYDDEGCRLFGEITRLPEYYLTRTELALLREVAPRVAQAVPDGTALVEYGACDEGKARLLLASGRFRAYVPVDVAGGALAMLVRRMAHTHPGLDVRPVQTDFLQPLHLPAAVDALPRLGFFPGSTIGNLDPATARRFLAQARRTLDAGTLDAGTGGPGACFLVGVDLRKDPAVLVPAYDDAAGVTAAFNLNLLARLNREAGGDFDLSAFAHRAVWNDAEGRIEMHLVSRRDQVARLAGRALRFREGETIHTENSYKHTPDEVASMARDAGWRVQAMWTDAARLFSLHLLSTESDG